MIKVLKPGGLLAISTPNLVWWPVVKAATMAKVRPFDGLENFSTWRGLKRTFGKKGSRSSRSAAFICFRSSSVSTGSQPGPTGIARRSEAR